MSQQKLSFSDLLSLIELDDHRGIIDKEKILDVVLQHGALPKFINDYRDALRLTIEREGDGFLVTQYPTELANETIGEIYPIATNRQQKRGYSSRI